MLMASNSIYIQHWNCSVCVHDNTNDDQLLMLTINLSGLGTNLIFFLLLTAKIHIIINSLKQRYATPNNLFQENMKTK